MEAFVRTMKTVFDAAVPGLFTIGILACCTAGLEGQSQDVVAPAAYGTAEAGGLVFWAFSPFAARRQLVVEESQIRLGKGQWLDSISVRRNAGDRMSYGSGRVQLEIWMSHTTRTSQALSTLFSGNRGKDFVRVYSGVVGLPGTHRLMKSPASWKYPHSIVIRLGTRFQYKGGPLLIETVTKPVPRRGMHKRPSAWWPIDGVTTALTGKVRALGKSCIPRMDPQPASADPGSLVLGGAAHFHLLGKTQASFALFALGFDNKRLGPYRLPLDLASIGAKGCALYNDWAYLHLTSVWTGTGARTQLANVALILPNQKSLVGRSLYGQWILPDARANALGLVFSNGVQATIAGQGSSLGMGWLESSSVTAKRGELLPGRAPVLKFTFTKR